MVLLYGTIPREEFYNYRLLSERTITQHSSARLSLLHVIMYINIFKDVTCSMFCLQYILVMMLQLKLSSCSCITKIQYVPDFQNTILTTYEYKA